MAQLDGRRKMDTYVILRRNGWKTADDLREAAARSTAEGERMPDDVAWIRSYVLAETDGTVGTVCVYQASSPEAIRKHAAAAELPVDEIVKVADTVIVRPDPVAAAA
jgi:sporulation protein YlmC with PRC-barrel domain